MDAPRFDPRTATEYDILGMAQRLRDRRLRDIAESEWSNAPSSKLNKGGAGAIIERFFGRSRFQQPQKMERFANMLNEHFDFTSFYKVLGLTKK